MNSDLSGKATGWANGLTHWVPISIKTSSWPDPLGYWATHGPQQQCASQTISLVGHRVTWSSPGQWTIWWILDILTHNLGSFLEDAWMSTYPIYKFFFNNLYILFYFENDYSNTILRSFINRWLRQWPKWP